MTENKIDYSIILAAGKGTRFYSALPKVLHRLSGRTLLERTIRAVAPYTAKEIIVVAGHGYDAVVSEVEQLRNKLSVDIKIVLQDKQLGTGHATQVAVDSLPNTNDSVIILPGDCPLIESSALSSFINSESKSSLSVLSLVVEDPFGFGRIVRSGNVISGIIEEKDATEEQRKIQEINSSIFLGKLSLFKEHLPKLKNNNKQGEYYLTDIVSSVVGQSGQVRAFVSEDNQSFLGANSRRELYNLQEIKRMKDLNDLMNNGVTIESTGSCFIDDSVQVGKDVFLGSNTRLFGKTVISDGVVIEGDCLIRNAKIGPNVHIKIGAYIEDCEINEACTLGPFVHIRPKSVLKKNVKIGNFVEVKAATLEEGVKANHLTYLGDLDIGENTNVGAGTIICNYDGKKKHRSIIGSNSFVGSNSTIISPTEIGSNAYVAAGSVINKKVPDNALAVARSRQENKEGWVKK